MSRFNHKYQGTEICDKHILFRSKQQNNISIDLKAVENQPVLKQQNLYQMTSLKLNVQNNYEDK